MVRAIAAARRHRRLLSRVRADWTEEDRAALAGLNLRFAEALRPAGQGRATPGRNNQR